MQMDQETTERTGGREGVDGAVTEPGGGSAGHPFPAPALGVTRDPVVEAYKRDVDRTLLRQNLRRSVTDRVANLVALQRLAAEARRAGGVVRKKS